MVPFISIDEYLTESGASPFGAWFDSLDPQAAAVVTVRLGRLSDGAMSNIRSVGHGVSELKIDRGPGYRIYFGWDGETLVILLGGGTKRRQSADIAAAQAIWANYKARKARARRS